VVSISHRLSPRHLFPAAHNDIDDVVIYLTQHAADFGADAACLTMGGSSAGGNLSLGASQHLHSRGLRVPLAWLGFCPLVDVRLKPEEKPRPPNFPRSDPLAFLTPLYDAYGGVEREKHRQDSRLHPILAPKEGLPEKMFFALAGIDILLHEQLSLVERLRGEIDEDGDEGRVVETLVIENGFHGFLECEYEILTTVFDGMSSHANSTEFRIGKGAYAGV
jgi:acetyl esterase/lipase